MVAVDRDLASAQATASALVVSPYLRSGELARFYEQSKATLNPKIATNIVLSDASGRQLLDTLRPYGAALPQHGNPDLLRRVFASGQPVISDLYIEGVRHRPVVSIDVPVTRDGKVVYDLSIGFFPERLTDILRQEELPEHWGASIFDSEGTIVARSRHGEQYVGRKGTLDLLAAMARAREGIANTETQEGISVTTVFYHSALSGWAAAIAVPDSELAIRLWRTLGWTLAGVLVLMLLGLAAASVISKRLTRPFEALIPMAFAHGRGEPIEIPPLHVKEADDLAHALAEGARLLERRTIERDRAEAQQQQSLAAKLASEEVARTRSAWFAYLSHELRTPLSVMLGCSDLIGACARSGSQDSKILEYCGRIDKTVDHLVGVVNEILDYAKWEAHEIVLNQQSLDVGREIRDAVVLMEGRAAQHGIQLRCLPAPALPPVWADRTRLRQVLLNLLSNALKFTPRGGRVTTDVAKARNGGVEFRVRDTGIGISAEDLPRVLQPFSQATGGTATKRGGTGLGLPLAKGLVDLHGGSLTISSTPGAGTDRHRAVAGVGPARELRCFVCGRLVGGDRAGHRPLKQPWSNAACRASS